MTAATIDHQPDFNELLAQYCDGQLSDAQQLAWFADELRRSEHHRREFYEYHDLHAELHWLENASARAATELPSADFSAAELPATKWWRRTFDAINTNESVSLILATLTMATILLSLALWIAPDWRSAAPLENGPSIEFVARISKSSAATFDQSSDGNMKNRDLFDDDKIVLNSGLVVIEYDTGARVVLEGPATYHINGRNGGDLRLGKLVARVETKASQGFAVHVPGARIIDLGTEFAAEVSQDGTSEVVVISGQIEIGGKGTAAGTVHRVRLAANQGVSLLADGRGIRDITKFTPDQVADIRQRLLQPTVALKSHTLLGATKRSSARDKLPSHYREIAIVNGSFEAPKTVTWSPKVDGWIRSRDGAFVIAPKYPNIAAVDGRQWLSLDSRNAEKRQPGWVFQKIGTVDETLTYRMDVVVGSRGDGSELAEYEAGFFTDDDGKFGEQDGPVLAADAVIATFSERDFTPSGGGQMVDAFVEWNAADSGRAGQDIYVGFYIPPRGYSGTTITQTLFDDILITTHSKEQEPSSR